MVHTPKTASSGIVTLLSHWSACDWMCLFNPPFCIGMAQQSVVPLVIFTGVGEAKTFYSFCRQTAVQDEIQDHTKCSSRRKPPVNFENCIISLVVTHNALRSRNVLRVGPSPLTRSTLN
jgi:hypothetical protein